MHDGIINIKACTEVFSLCEASGVKLWAEGEKLRYQAPKNALTKNLIEKIKESKNDIIFYIQKLDALCGSAEALPLTPIQSAYYMGRREDYELGNVNAHYYMEAEYGEIDCDRFQSAVNTVIQHQDALRNVILPNGLQLIQERVPEYSVPVHVFQSEQEREESREAWSHHKYPYGVWPMFDIHISSVQSCDWHLHISFDCMILDAWSLLMMLHNLMEVYQGKDVTWPNYSFRQYCLEESSYRENKKEQSLQAEAYWSRRAPEMPPSPQLPYCKNLFEIKSPRFFRLHSYLSKEDTRILYERAKQYRLTPAAVICTAYMKTLSEFSTEQSLSINITLYNRLPLHRDVTRVLGDFTNNALASYEGEGQTFLEEVKLTQAQFWTLVKYKDYHGVDLIKKLSRSQPGKAVMPVVFTGVLQGLKSELNYFPEGMREIYCISQTPQVVLDYQATDFSGRLSVNWDYVTEAFTEKQIQAMYQSHLALLKAIIQTNDWNMSI